VFECSGAEAAISNSLNLIRPMGSLVQLGLGAAKVCLNMETVVHKRLQILGSVGHSMKTWELMMRMLSQTHFDLNKIISHKLPLSKWEEAFDLMRKKEALKIVIKKEFGSLDVLINNAGVTGWTDLFSITPEKWDFVINTNLKGTFFCCLEAAKIMKESGGGTIVNVSTNCAELGVKNLVAYASSKGGIHTMTKQLAVELAPYHIRINTFAPGPTNVKRNLDDDPEYRNSWGGCVPLKRTADEEEMIAPALFLASEDSSFMTGQLFFVDGGWSIQGKIPEENMEKSMKKNS